MSLGSAEALACPEFDKVKQLGNKMLPMYEVVQFYATDCEGSQCAAQSEIDTFLQHFQTYMFMVNSQIDFSKYGEGNFPISTACKKIFTFTPYSGWTNEINLYMAVNEVDTQDDYF